MTWSHSLCLFQSDIEWNPADGIYGFFDRLRTWLGKAAIKDMDPLEGPMEPPHHVTDFSHVPFVVRANAPIVPGDTWFGLAELEKHSNRIEVVGWNDLTREWPVGRLPALAVVLPKALPMEFPALGKDFFAELAKQGLDKERILRDLRIAATLTPQDEYAYLVLGVPMRRSAGGQPKHHFAVWAVGPKTADSLRNAAPKDQDWQELTKLKRELNEIVYSIFENSTITWCPVMEDRSEIIVRRDAGTPLSSLEGKRILLLGCGGLGSWIAEIVARANPALLHLVDNSLVKPGLLARQNFLLQDIGSNKAEALAKRIRAITSVATVQHFSQEAHDFITKDLERFRAYDLVIDSTASNIFQMKLERDWPVFECRTPNLLSIIVDATAQQCLAVTVPGNASAGMWDAYYGVI